MLAHVKGSIKGQTTTTPILNINTIPLLSLLSFLSPPPPILPHSRVSVIKTTYDALDSINGTACS